LKKVPISISRLHFPVTTLGPGRRVGIWFQGCSIRCPGCISADTWGFDKGATTVDKVVDSLTPWMREASGVTISGGEPFDQVAALLELLRALPLEADQDVLVFSGHPIERLAEALELAPGRIDALISDPFDMSRAHTLALRGSDNQRLHLLTELGRRKFAVYERELTTADRSLDVMFDSDGTVWLAGIPRRSDMLHLRELLREQGHEIVTTDARSNRPHRP
jgi:anaerobic ribonucleoside-triphosphate reductase activating protein